MDYSQFPEMLTLSQAATLLAMPTEYVSALLSSGYLESIDLNGKTLVLKTFVLDFIDSYGQVCYNSIKALHHHPASVEMGEPMLFDNHMTPDFSPCPEGDTDMAKNKKVNQYITINGEKHWITATTMQEFADKVSKLSGAPKEAKKHAFADYAWTWFNTYSKPNVATATATTYRRQLMRYLLPAFEGLAVEDITTDDVQRLFNGMTGAKATKDKARMVLNQILDFAVEDGLLSQNPLKSRRLKVTGEASKATPPYSVEQMRYLVQHIGDIKNPVDRAYLALQALHPLRLEEVLGLEPGDVDTQGMKIHIRRAVTHPTRNQPEVKETKTDSSCRTIGLSSMALPYLPQDASGKFLFGGDAPLSYTQVRRMCNRIKQDTGFEENITPIRFRTTVLTDIYDQTKDIKLAQAAAGHTTPAMTLKHYVKGRETAADATAAVERAYSA